MNLGRLSALVHFLQQRSDLPTCFSALGRTFEFKFLAPFSAPDLDHRYGHTALCSVVRAAFSIVPDDLVRNLTECQEFIFMDYIGVKFVGQLVRLCYFEESQEVSLDDFREFALAYVRAALPFRFEHPGEFLGRQSEAVQDLLRPASLEDLPTAS